MKRPIFRPTDFAGWRENIAISRKMENTNNEKFTQITQITIKGLVVAVNGYNIKYVPEGMRETATLVLTIFDNDYKEELSTATDTILWNSKKYAITGFNYASGEGIKLYFLEEKNK